MRGAVDERHLAAEATHGLCQLDADRAGAENQQAARDGFHAGRFAAAPDALELAQAGDGRHDRVGSGREDDVLGAVGHAVDFDHARSGEPAGAAQQLDASVGQPALLSGVGVVRHHEVAPSQRRGDVDLRAGGRVAGGVDRFAGAQQRL